MRMQNRKIFADRDTCFHCLQKKNGVLERDGHTEATVDLMRLAGLKECGLCCEIMREDGTMMRTTELMELAEKWNICFITIAAIQEYRKKHEKLVECAAVAKLPTKYGEFKAYGYQNILNGEHHVALVKGEIGDGEDVLCRVHSECLTGDVFGSLRCDCRGTACCGNGTDRKKKAAESCFICGRREEASDY